VNYLGTPEFKDDDTAQLILKKMRTFDFVAVLVTLSDALGTVNMVSKKFQADDLTHHAVSTVVEGAIDAFTNCYLSETPCYQSSLRALLKEMESQVNRNVAAVQVVKLLGQDIQYSPDSEKAFHEQITAFFHSMVEDLNARFPKDNTQLLDALDILNPASHRVSAQGPDSPCPEAAGDSELYILKEFFGKKRGGCTTFDEARTPARPTDLFDFAPFVDADELAAEWPQVMKMLHQSQTSTLADFWATVLSLKCYPHVSKLAAVMLVTPMNSACCERTFSAMNIIKTRLRNLMLPDLLNANMMCHIIGPDTEHAQAVDALVVATRVLWSEIKDRDESKSTANQPRQRKRPERENLIKQLDDLAKYESTVEAAAQLANSRPARAITHSTVAQAFECPVGYTVEKDFSKFKCTAKALVAFRWGSRWLIGKLVGSSCRSGSNEGRWRVIYFINDFDDEKATPDEIIARHHYFSDYTVTWTTLHNALQYYHDVGQEVYGVDADCEWVGLRKE
jgi:hypothetical protein